MCVTRGRWVYFSGYFKSGVIDILVILSKLGAALPYLHKYQVPPVEIDDPQSHIYVSRGAGELSSVATHNPELLTFSWFRPSWEPPRTFKIGDPYLHICVSRGAGEFSSVASLGPKLLTGVRFGQDRGRLGISWQVHVSCLEFAVRLHICIYFKSQVSFCHKLQSSYLLSVRCYWLTCGFNQIERPYWHISICNRCPSPKFAQLMYLCTQCKGKVSFCLCLLSVWICTYLHLFALSRPFTPWSKLWWMRKCNYIYYLSDWASLSLKIL